MSATTDAGFVEAFFAPDSARALDRRAPSLTLRAYAPHGATIGGGLGPTPTEALRVTFKEGSSAVTLDGEDHPISQLELTTRPLSWGFSRVAGALLLHLAPRDGGDRRSLVLAETVAPTEEDVQRELEPLRLELAAYAGLDGAQPPTAAARVAVRRSGSERYGLRLEGDVLVLRDLASTGPKQNAGRYHALALACLALGLLGAVVFAARVSSGASAGALAGVAVVPLVLFVGAFAMQQIASHASRYAAPSAPLATFADDGVVVAPWVSRQGAVDPTPDGRLGAAIACGEIHSVEVRQRDGVHAVTLDGLHGPIEVAVIDDPAVAAEVQRAVEAAVACAASPKKRVTALMRAATTREQRA